MATDEPTRQRLLEALAQEIAREGYANAKVQEVARIAQVSLRTYYDAFPSKEAGFLELQYILLEQLATSIETSIDLDQPSWRAVMTSGFDTYFRLLMAQPKLTAAVTHELTTLSPEGAAAREWARERFAAMLCTLVDAGRARFPDVPSRPLTPLLARGILGAILELVATEVVDEAEVQFDDLVEAGTDLLWSVVTNVDVPA